MALIADSEDLAALCRRLSRCEYVTVDTEFLRETTFWPILCVVQLASEHEAAAIDAMAPGLDLSPMLDLMRDANVLKVFHAARQDLEIFWKLMGEVPAPMFDTQVAAMVSGYGDQVGYGELVQSIAGVHVDKSSRFTDWSRRPLDDAQVAYAIADVTHLRVVYSKLKDKLAETGRMAWLEDEMRVLTSASTYEQHPDDAWERLKARARKPRDLAMLMELCAWREREAQARDVPRARVLKDDALTEIAFAAPKDAKQLTNLRAFPRSLPKGISVDDVLAVLERGRARDPKTLPPIERERRGGNGSSSGPATELLKVLLRQVSEDSGVASRLIATSDDLDAIVNDPKSGVAALEGWRKDLFGERALALLRGDLALTIEAGKVVVLEWRNAEGPPPAP